MLSAFIHLFENVVCQADNVYVVGVADMLCPAETERFFQSGKTMSNHDICSMWL